MNQSTSDDYCNNSACREVIETNQLITYYVFVPIHMVLETAGFTFLLVALLVQVKQQRAYVYQIVLVANECLYDIFAPLSLLFKGPFALMPRFRQSYVLMWYTARLATMMPNVFFTNILLMSMVTAVDRLTAIRKPVVHRQLNHKRLQITVTVLGLVISIGTSVFDCFRYSLNATPAGYDLVVDKQYTGTTLAIGLTHFCSVIRLTIGAILVASNALLIGAYKRFNRNAELLNVNSHGNKQRLDERPLILLTVCQCSKSSINVILFDLYYAMQYSSLKNCECFMKPFGRIIDDVIVIVELIAVFICIGCSRQCKLWLRQAIGWIKTKSGIVSDQNLVSSTNAATS